MTKDLYQESLNALALGKTVDYPSTYDPSVLEAVPRSLNRNPLGIGDTVPFKGEDLWNAYEFSWLNHKGKPMVALLECKVPATTPNIIESKSFKLYLNSFNQSRFHSSEEVHQKLIKDLSLVAGGDVSVTMQDLSASNLPVVELPGECIDDLDIEVTHYQPDASLLKVDSEQTVEKTLVSHLLKSNCLITNQPDWGSLYISYQGPLIDEAALLEYIISFREHNEFHEQCVERIFCDLMAQCRPQKLTVLARYTRRGGLDINPIRSTETESMANLRLIRQ
ncbi:NADPH-dependent 7-cyano-7-deazaguanine reductase QueF [Planctobacterium marinum]|uniref:NADPH-dependent 7-cyano-7-deazaguanine reductase n=1 Tax=Planctobacterium marinum TaxID=1631968 RepID=A0AA48KVL4_9ALTE|nr:NADPH-dependent 7-cyano-7-deazaguanine reductase [Planctobacterium marinum]